MKIPFAKIFRRYTKSIPELVINRLERDFPNAKNIDWEQKDQIFEAIFYLEGVEHIAHITKKGILLEFKKNLWPHEIPENIKNDCQSSGEIMNVILITRGIEKFFEVIIRDEKLDRFLFIYNYKGELLNQKVL